MNAHFASPTQAAATPPPTRTCSVWTRIALRSLPLSLSLSLLSPTASAEFSAEKLALIDRPFIGEQMALSPDGRYLAYTENDSDRLLLVVADTERRIKKLIPLTAGQRTDRAARRLLVLRWVSPQRLVLQESDGTIAAIDADGSRPATLWSSSDDGLINDDQLRNYAFVAIPAKARVIPSTPAAPNQILVEGASLLGAERLANLFRVDALTGEATLMNPNLYWGNQVAVYGPGDLIVQAPIDGALGIEADPPPAEIPVLQLPEVSVRQAMLRALRGETGATRETVERWRFNELSSLTPAEGGPVGADSSSTGEMLYDRLGRPRLLLEQSPKGNRQRYSYTESGKPPMEPNIVPYSLEEILGQRSRRQETLGRLGEFELRAENYFAERSYPIAFDYNPDVVYLASSVGRDTYGIFSLNLRTKERVDLAPGLRGIDLASGDPLETGDDILVFDDPKQKLVGIRYRTLRPETFWLDRELGELQAALNELMPRHAVEIVSWDAARTRFAIRASSEDDPGALFLYHRADKRLEEITGRAPWLRDTELNSSGSIRFETPDGVQLSGYLTLPNHSKVDPPPLLIFCHPGLWDRAGPGFNREAEILADMGMAVMRLNYRGSAGFGRKHLTAVQNGFDTVPVQDITAAVEWLAGKYGIDRKRIVVMGEGFGGYIALRALQTRPEVFRAAITFNAPTNLGAWAKWHTIPGLRPMKPFSPTYDFFGSYYDFRSIVRTAFVKEGKRGDEGLAEAVEKGEFKKPVLLITSPNSSDLTPLSSLLGGLGLGLGLEGTSIQRMGISGDLVGGSLETRTRAFEKIEEFLNFHLYQYDSEIGNLREVKGEPVPGRK